jgi:hypothetical protein
MESFWSTMQIELLDREHRMIQTNIRIQRTHDRKPRSCPPLPPGSLIPVVNGRASSRPDP